MGTHKAKREIKHIFLCCKNPHVSCALEDVEQLRHSFTLNEYASKS